MLGIFNHRLNRFGNALRLLLETRSGNDSLYLLEHLFCFFLHEFVRHHCLNWLKNSLSQFLKGWVSRHFLKLFHYTLWLLQKRKWIGQHLHERLSHSIRLLLEGRIGQHIFELLCEKLCSFLHLRIRHHRYHWLHHALRFFLEARIGKCGLHLLCFSYHCLYRLDNTLSALLEVWICNNFLELLGELALLFIDICLDSARVADTKQERNRRDSTHL
mmetsp:Transcript_93997/g.148594  ORF Transcript_93997/g.148594 Transcript_93997/m.148594 type:complete len:216 (-) Transcript_93997:65-712(-)